MVTTDQTIREQRKPIDFDAFYRLHHDRLYRALATTTREPDVAAEAVDEAMTGSEEDPCRILSEMVDRDLSVRRPLAARG